MTRNKRLRFLCRQVHVRVESTDTPFTCGATSGQILRMPIAHMEGNYFCDTETLDELRRDNRIVFRYSTPSGEVSVSANPNGSLDNIAGICSAGGNVVGMMPHPERSAEPELGGTDGMKIFRSMVGALVVR